jgi:anthranilate phosphoribosyltransferase
MTFGQIMEPLLAMRSLEEAEATGLMEFLIGGQATDAQIASILTALRLKGCVADELTSFATVLRRNSLGLSGEWTNLVDTCGTGGGRPSFNISTAAAIVAASAGARIAKHGNRAVTSACGSADVLEALGVRLGAEPERLAHQLETTGIAFLFAPAHHPALRHAGNARRELGFRTVFNQLGPLANPAGARRQLIGVYEASLLRPMGEALARLGADRAILAHGEDGLDEISPTGRTWVAIIEGGDSTLGGLHPAAFGLEPLPDSCLAPGATLQENAAILREAVTDASSMRAAAVLPSAAAAIWLAGIEEDLKDAATLARDAIATGKAASKLDELIEVSQAA